jgi:hypothetical protein
MEWHEFEAEGPNGTTRYGLSGESGSFQVFNSSGSDLGTGCGMQTYAFQHPEGRTYFKRWFATDRQLGSAICEVEWLKNAIRGCVTASGRVRRKKLLKLVETIK